MTFLERPLLQAGYFRFGSGCDRRLLKFIAGKPPLKVRFPEAAARRRVVSTQSGLMTHGKADIQHWS
jgi:hypothetical protein